MGASALAQSVDDTLAAAMRVKNAVAPKTAEILRLKPLIQMKKITDEAVEVANDWRSHLVTSAEGLSDAVKRASNEDVPWDGSKTKALLANLDNASEQLRINHGLELSSSMEEWAAAASSRSADEGRYGRRAATRVREAFGACEVPRLRMLEVLAEAVAVATIKLQTAVDAHRYDDMFQMTLAKYPVITEYLAR